VGPRRGRARPGAASHPAPGGVARSSAGRLHPASPGSRPPARIDRPAAAGDPDRPGQDGRDPGEADQDGGHPLQEPDGHHRRRADQGRLWRDHQCRLLLQPGPPGRPRHPVPPGGPVPVRLQPEYVRRQRSGHFALVSGPKIGDFESGGLVAACLFNDALIVDRYGLLPLQAYAQLKNDDWRFAAGLQFDIFNPLNPNTLTFAYLGGSGNAGGGFPGQARVERYFHPDDESQITLTLGISEPISTTVNNSLRISEDNGWPDVEMRAALALGPLQGEGPLAKRPFEAGVSGLVGQIRTTDPGGGGPARR